MPAEGVTTTAKEPDILEQASRALAAGRAKEALELCRSEAGRRAPAARSETVTALALEKLGETKTAAETAARALRRKECDAPCLELLGAYYERCGDKEKALECLRRFKDDGAEVRQGFECGIGVKNYNDVKVGDQIEVYQVTEFARTL